MGGKMIRPEEHEEIVRLYKSGIKECVIAERLGRDRKAIWTHVRQAVKNGEIKELRPTPTRKFTKPKKRKEKKPEVKVSKNFIEMRGNNKPQLPEKPDGVVVKCTKAVSKKCVYGIEYSEAAGLCNYILCEGHSRGCPPEACTHFAHRCKENPKREVRM